MNSIAKIYGDAVWTSRQDQWGIRRQHTQLCGEGKAAGVSPQSQILPLSNSSTSPERQKTMPDPVLLLRRHRGLWRQAIARHDTVARSVLLIAGNQSVELVNGFTGEGFMAGHPEFKALFALIGGQEPGTA